MAMSCLICGCDKHDLITLGRRNAKLKESLKELLVIAEWAANETSPPGIDQDKIDRAKELLK
jgi:hypothetical protein